MSGSEWLGVGGVLAILFIGLALIRTIAGRVGASPEVARKSIHVAMGLTCESFPWVFDRSLPVMILAVIAIIPLGLIRMFPALRTSVGSALHGIDRPSYGEVLFAPAVASVFMLANGDLHLYLIPVLILTIADAGGALFGTRWGRRRYGCGAGFKTVEGSAMFGFTAFLCGVLPLAISGRVDVFHALWIGAILGILAMMAEGVSDRGFDNLVLPVGCFFMLEKLIDLETSSLIGRAVVLVILLGLVLAGSRWSTLNGGALFGCALLGYGCAVIADWRFALPPVAVFVCHVISMRNRGLSVQIANRLDAVLSYAIGCMPWVIASESRLVSASVALAGVSFAMGAQLAILETATRITADQRFVKSLRPVIIGFLVASLPGLIWLWPQAQRLPVPVTLAVGGMWLATLLFQRIYANYRQHVTGLWIVRALLALAASIPALLIPA